MTEIVRIIFRTFDDLEKYKNWKTKLDVWLIKNISIPCGYKGFAYDHGELLTPEKQRISIRVENKNSKNVSMNGGVYCVQQDGFWNSEEAKNRKYKLVFAFEISKIQKEKLKNFVKRHNGEPYSLRMANWNVIVQKFLPCCKYLKIDDWNNPTRKVKRWDCITLLMRLLVEIELIPKIRNDGSIVNMLGVTAFDMAMLLIDMHKKTEIICEYVISREIYPDEYIEGIYTFYEVGSKVTRDNYEVSFEAH